MTYATLRRLAQGAPAGTYLHCWDDDEAPTEYELRAAISALDMRDMVLATDDHGIYITARRR